MTPGRKGAIAETMIAAEATRLGFDVYRPIADGGRYDLIVDCGSRLLRVQVQVGDAQGFGRRDLDADVAVDTARLRAYDI